MSIAGSLSRNPAIMVQICTVCHSIFKVLHMKKKMAIFLAMVQMTILGVAQTPKDSCFIRKDSLCINKNKKKSDSINLSLKKYYLFQTNITNKKDNKSNLPKMIFSSKDFYRGNFFKLELINIIGSHLSR